MALQLFCLACSVSKSKLSKPLSIISATECGLSGMPYAVSTTTEHDKVFVVGLEHCSASLTAYTSSSVHAG